MVKWLAVIFSAVTCGAELIYIGSRSEPEWDEFAKLSKAATNRIDFVAKKNEERATLFEGAFIAEYSQVGQSNTA